MSEPFIGEIRMFGGNFAPRGFFFCDGQLLPISPYTALFSLIGTFYGGDGRTTFGLPDLRGRFPTQWGSGPGLSPVQIGQKGGAERHAHSVIDYKGENFVAFGPTNAAANDADHRPPFLGISFIIAAEGIYPSRS